MSENIVLTSVDERGIAEVILNRPEKNNAYNGDMIIELIKSLRMCQTSFTCVQTYHSS